MTNSFFIVPYLPGMLAFVLLTLILIFYVWAPDGIPEKLKDNLVFTGLKTFLYLFYFGLGIVFLDSVGVWVSGIFGYADWRYQLTSILFSLVMGIQILLGTWLARPRKITLAYGIIVIISVICYIHIYIPNQTRLRAATTNLFVLLAIFIGIALCYGIFEKVLNKRAPKSETPQPQYLWDFTPKLKQIFSKQVNFVLWVLMLIDTVLKFYGGSLFIWPF